MFFYYAADKRSLCRRGDGQICSIEESLAEKKTKKQQQRVAKSVCSVKCSSINNAGFA